ncbi:MAG: hypothetical protein RBS24_01955 [Bacilli bacterium]|nr:hypothetical protein [Bacilli bacterium]
MHSENPDAIHIYNQITHNESKLEKLEKELVVNVTSSVRLDYIKSIVAKEHSDESSVSIKDIFTLILADSKKLIFVISPTKTKSELLKTYERIVEDESILRRMYVAKDGNRGIFYEVKLYE